VWKTASREIMLASRVTGLASSSNML